MLKKSAVENILAAALESGADFAEIYAERTKRSSIAMVNGKVETALGGMDYGAGVRLFFGNQAIYGFTNDLSEESLIRIAREGAATAFMISAAGKGWRSVASTPSVSCRKACPSRERRSSSGWHPRRQGHITMPLRRQGQAILR